ncbi:MAG: transporter substrate-binding domain-containing protein [Paracoccaceae bacterium]
MKTLLKTLAAAALIALPIAGPAQADLTDILEAGVVKIGVPESFPPFGSLNEEGEHVGYDVDVAMLIAEDLGVEVEIIPVVSKQRIPFLETDKLDLVISTLGANPERAKSIWFSAAYAPFYTGAFGKADLAVESIADLGGLKVGLTGGTIEDIQVTEEAPEGTAILRFGDNAATQAAYVAGQVDAIITSNVVAASLSEANPGLDLSTKYISKYGASFIGIEKGEIDLLQWVNVWIMHKKLNGTLNEISVKWLGQPLPELPTF